MKAGLACAWFAIGCSGSTGARDPAAATTTPPTDATAPAAEPRLAALLGECIFGELRSPYGEPLVYGVPHVRAAPRADDEARAVRLADATLTGGRDGEFRGRIETLLPRFERCWHREAAEHVAASSGGTLVVEGEVGADGKLGAIAAAGADALAPCAQELTRLRLGKGPTGHLAVTLRFLPPETRTATEYAWLPSAAIQLEARPALATCWRDALARDPSQGENVVLAVVLDDGEVASADVAGPWDEALRSCLADGYPGLRLDDAPAGDVHLACSAALLPPPGVWPGTPEARLALWPDHVVLDGTVAATWDVDDPIDWTQEGIYPAVVEVTTQPHWMEIDVDPGVWFEDVLIAIAWARVNGQQVRLAGYDLVLGVELGALHTDAPSADAPRAAPFRHAIDVRLDDDAEWSEAAELLQAAAADGARYATLGLR